MRNLCTATKSSPCSLQLEKACVQQRKPNAAKNKFFFNKNKKRRQPAESCSTGCPRAQVSPSSFVHWFNGLFTEPLCVPSAAWSPDFLIFTFSFFPDKLWYKEQCDSYCPAFVGLEQRRDWCRAPIAPKIICPINPGNPLCVLSQQESRSKESQDYFPPPGMLVPWHWIDNFYYLKISPFEMAPRRPCASFHSSSKGTQVNLISCPQIRAFSPADFGLGSWEEPHSAQRWRCWHALFTESLKFESKQEKSKAVAIRFAKVVQPWPPVVTLLDTR